VKLFGRNKTANEGYVGLAFNGIDWAFVWADPTREVGQLRHWEVLSDGSAQNAVTLGHRVSALGLEGVPCYCILDSSQYSMQLVEAPQVPEDELVMAIQFQLKDDVGGALDEIDLQVFEVPDGAYQNQGRMFYAAAVERRLILEVRDQVLASGLALEGISVRELAFRNLSRFLSDDRDGLASLEVRGGMAKLSLLKAGELFLCRNLTTTVDHAAMSGADWVGSFERLVVEIQRSLDYFENQMGQGQILKLVLAPVPGLTNQLIEELNRSMVTSAQALDVNRVWNTGTMLSAQDQHDLLFAAGAALSDWSMP